MCLNWGFKLKKCFITIIVVIVIVINVAHGILVAGVVFSVI